MRAGRWVSALGSLLTVTAGIFGGIAVALLAERPASAAGLQISSVTVISYRANDSVAPAAELTGWEAPMFYTTPAEGAQPGPPAGNRPIGVWAPGDTWQRSLVVRNVNPDLKISLSGIEVVLSGERALANWYTVDVQDSAGRSLYAGTLAEMAAHLNAVTQHLVLDPGSQETFTFTVHLDINTDQRLQGKTVLADLRIHAELEGFATGKVTGGAPNTKVANGSSTGGFVIMRKEGDAVPTGNLQYQDHANGLNFHADAYTDLLISLDRTKSWFRGSGQLNGVRGYTFEARAYDLGEPGRTDEFEITIYDPTGQVVYSSGSLVGGGNVQIHK